MITLLFSLVSFLSLADEPFLLRLPHSVGFDVGATDQSQISRRIFGQYYFDSGHSMMGSLGQTFGDDDFDVIDVSIGYSTDPLEDWIYLIRASTYASASFRDRKFQIQTTRAFDQWALDLHLGLQNTLVQDATSEDFYGYYNMMIGAEVHYYWQNFFFDLGFHRTFYPDSIQQLDSTAIDSVIDSEAVLLAYGLSDRQLSARLGWGQRNYSLFLDIRRHRSAVDRSVQRVRSIGGAMEWGSWAPSIELGRSVGEDEAATEFAELSVAYLF